jgi:RHS repeat-associated protein
MGNGVQGAFTYNDHLQLASLRYFKSGLTQDPLNLGYDYTSATQPNNNGQVQAMHYYTQPGTEDTNKSEAFTYDSWLRLKAAQTINVNVNTAGTWSLGWTYDRLGNRKQQTLTGGNLPGGIGQPNFTIDETTNRINGFSYDSAGNLTADGVFTYAYDGANRMKQAQQVASPNTVTNSTYFGPLRIKKVVNSTTTRYLYSGSKLIAEYVNGSTTPSKEYIYSGSSLLATITSTGTTYHHPDHLSNRAETDGTGAVVRTFGSFPYGESWYESTADPMKFTTYSRDNGTGETDLDYAMFRYYNSGQGRFMGSDPNAGHMKAPQSLNRYSYVVADPVNLVDPLGLDQTNQDCMNKPCMYYDCYNDGTCSATGGTDLGNTVGAGWTLVGAFMSGGGIHQPLLDGPENGKGGDCTASLGTTSIISGNATTNAPTIAAGATIGGLIDGAPGAFLGGIVGSLFGVGGTVSYVPSTKSLYAGPTLVFAPALGGGNGFGANVVSVPPSQNPDSIASSWSYSVTFQPTPLLGSTVTKSPGSGPPVVGPSVGTRVPVSFGVSYSFPVKKGGC